MVKASRGTGPSNVILRPPCYVGTIRGGKLNFKTSIVKYSGVVYKYVPLQAQLLIFFTNQTANINEYG